MVENHDNIELTLTITVEVLQMQGENFPLKIQLQH